MVSPRPFAAAAGVIGLFLLLFALTVMGGWLLHWPWAVTLGSAQQVIVFGTGINLALLGMGVLTLAVGSARP
ncbi:MAG: hypothetical protein JSV72_17180, partial [Ralstonia sp.]